MSRRSLAAAWLARRRTSTPGTAQNQPGSRTGVRGGLDGRPAHARSPGFPAVRRENGEVRRANRCGPPRERCGHGRCGRFPAHTRLLVAVCQAVDTHSYAADSRRCSFRGVQRQPHRQATPIGPGAAQAPGSEEHDGGAGRRTSPRLPVQDQPAGERPSLHQPARCARPVRRVRGRGRAHGRLAHADGQGLAPAGLVARLRRHPVQRLHRPGDGRGEPADVRSRRSSPGCSRPTPTRRRSSPARCRSRRPRTSRSGSRSAPAARSASGTRSVRCACGRSSTRVRCTGSWAAGS